MPKMRIQFDGGGELTIEREGQKLIQHIAAEVFRLREKPEAIGHWRAEDMHRIFVPSSVVSIQLEGVEPEFKLR
ncbi:MAG: hypothetical protein ACYS99_00125 [Planctomycetota bacterium]|jgi:hypothetical protein